MRDSSSTALSSNSIVIIVINKITMIQSPPHYMGNEQAVTKLPTISGWVGLFLYFINRAHQNTVHKIAIITTHLQYSTFLLKIF